MTNDQNVHVIHFPKKDRRPKRKRRVHRKASQIISVRHNQTENTNGPSLPPIDHHQNTLPYSVDVQWLTAAKMTTNHENQPGQSLSISSMNVNTYKSSNRIILVKREENDTDRRKRWPMLWIKILAIFGVLFLLGVFVAVCVLLSLNSEKTTTTTTIGSSTDPTSTSSTTSTTSTTMISYRWNSTGITVAGITGSSGLAANQLDSPYDILFVSPNSLYISDETNCRIQKWIVGASIGSTVAGLTNGTSGPSTFNTTGLFNPRDITVDSNGNLYIVDTSWNRVLFWPNGSSLGTTVAGQGGYGSANNQLFNPTGIVRDPSSGTLYIADEANHRVMQYLPGASSGTVVCGGFGQGINSSQLNLPAGLYFDSSSNSLVIANSGANNIVRWVLGASSWTLVTGSSTGSSGTTSTLLDNPRDVTFDSIGNMYVADTYNDRIQFFLAGQSNGTTIVGISGSAGSGPNLLDGPYSITLDSQLNLYVADYNNYRVQQFIRY